MLTYTHEISERGPNNLLVCPMKDVQCWRYMSTLITEITLKPFASPSRNSDEKEQKKKKQQQWQQKRSLR